MLILPYMSRFCSLPFSLLHSLFTFSLTPFNLKAGAPQARLMAPSILYDCLVIYLYLIKLSVEIITDYICSSYSATDATDIHWWNRI